MREKEQAVAINRRMDLVVCCLLVQKRSRLDDGLVGTMNHRLLMLFLLFNRIFRMDLGTNLFLLSPFHMFL